MPLFVSNFLIYLTKMKEMKILAAVLLLSVGLEVALFFVLALLDDSGFTLFPGARSARDPIILQVLFAVVLGAIHGFVIGLASIFWLVGFWIFYRSNTIAPLWLTSIYAIIIGSSLTLFYFGLLGASGQYPNYIVAVRKLLLELTGIFCLGFLTAILPLMAIRKYFRLENPFL